MDKQKVNLDRYFRLFDEARKGENERKVLSSLFSGDIEFVLAGYTQKGIESWEKFIDTIYRNNKYLKHIHEGWIFDEKTGCYETKWAIAGQRADNSVFVQTGRDIARVNSDGLIVYLENIPDESTLFNQYK